MLDEAGTSLGGARFAVLPGKPDARSTPYAGPVSSAAETVEVVIGRIGKPHGLRGEVTVEVRTDEPERRYTADAVLRVEAPRGSDFSHRSLTVSGTRWHQTTLLVSFVEIADRNEAEAARGMLLHATVSTDATPDDPEEYYDHQLVGLAAHDLHGAHLGEVTGLVHGGAQDLLAIKALDGRDTLVPFVTALVPEVDLAGRRVVIADRPGLVAALLED